MTGLAAGTGRATSDATGAEPPTQVTGRRGAKSETAENTRRVCSASAGRPQSVALDPLS